MHLPLFANRSLCTLHVWYITRDLLFRFERNQERTIFFYKNDNRTSYIVKKDQTNSSSLQRTDDFSLEMTTAQVV
jgi:hypothetical protein